MASGAISVPEVPSVCDCAIEEHGAIMVPVKERHLFTVAIVGERPHVSSDDKRQVQGTDRAGDGDHGRDVGPRRALIRSIHDWPHRYGLR
jgi:hypothetical protein